ncbi:MAG: FAD-dependent oxidoreductase [Pseudonocardiaceae bacterium]
MVLFGAVRGEAVLIDPEQFKLVALDMLDETGVRLLFHALASGVASDSEAQRVVFETKSGPIVIDAQVVVDCIGDGDVATASGVSFEVGRPE